MLVNARYIGRLLRTYVTGPEKTGLIYTKYTYSYYGAYLFSVYAIQILSVLCIHDEFCVKILFCHDEILHFKDRNLGQILHIYESPCSSYVASYSSLLCLLATYCAASLNREAVAVRITPPWPHVKETEHDSSPCSIKFILMHCVCMCS